MQRQFVAEHVGAAFRAEALRVVARSIRGSAGPAFLIATQVHHAIDVLAILCLGGADDALHLIAASHYGLSRQRPGQIANHLSALSGRARSGGADSLARLAASTGCVMTGAPTAAMSCSSSLARGMRGGRFARSISSPSLPICARSRRGGRWFDSGGLAFCLAHRLRQRLGLVGAADVAETRVGAQFRAALDTPHGDNSFVSTVTTPHGSSQGLLGRSQRLLPQSQNVQTGV